MIRFYYLDKPAEPPLPCILCKKATTHRVGYAPPGVTLERPVCLECGEGAFQIWRIIQKFRELSRSGTDD